MSLVRYLSMTEVARLRGVSRASVSTNRARYKDTEHAFPEPDVQVGRHDFGWHPSRQAELRAWQPPTKAAKSPAG